MNSDISCHTTITTDAGQSHKKDKYNPKNTYIKSHIIYLTLITYCQHKNNSNL